MPILLVEDESTLAEPLLALLRRERYEVSWAANLNTAWTLLERAEPDLAVLDVMLPEGEDAGFQLAEHLRDSGFAGGILFLTARDDIEDRVRGLDLGGDDYLVKPFSLNEFLARVRAILRRDAGTKRARLERGPLSVDLSGRRVTWDSRLIELSEKEFAMLEFFALHPDRVFAVDELLERFFASADSGTRLVRMYVYHLRQKIAPEVIVTVPGGYGLGI